jgi:arsenate reductase
MTHSSTKGILFLCVANSARSQMAEGLARAIAPPGMAIWSAGSRPTRVRPEAVTVLGELGIDITAHRAKSMEEVPMDQVDTVVTLCAEEECPLVPGAVRRIPWHLPDPAAVEGSHQERLAAFRAVRDELRRRLPPLLGVSGTPY